MNRRNFIRGLLAVGASFTVLPPATTYERVWRAGRSIPNPDWENAEFELVFIQTLNPERLVFTDLCGHWKFIADDLGRDPHESIQTDFGPPVQLRELRARPIRSDG